jgi:hypothetical protein
MESTYMSIYEWINKENVVCIHNEILFGHKEEHNSVICRKMGGTKGHYIT